MAALLPVALVAGLNALFPFRPALPYSTIIMAADSIVLHAFLSQDDKWRLKTELYEISPELKKAILFKEDKYFYWHPGFNPVAMLKAAVQNFYYNKHVSGASTITMQVVRLLEPRERTYQSKLIELFRAMQLEWLYSKDEILQLYLNLVPFGGNVEGVKSAAMLYFGRQPDHLSLGQITALTVIPNRPVSLRPGVNNSYIEQERNKWLRKFKEANLFETQQVEDALNESFSPGKFLMPKAAPHLSIRLRNLYPQADAIYTAIHRAKQAKVEQLAYNYMQRFRYRNIRHAAVLVVNNRTGRVEAYLGSPDFYAEAGQVDGVKAVRSPGSTLKPLIYAMAFDAGHVTPKMVLHDVSTNFGGYAPENFDRKFNGAVTAEKALAYSLNIPAVKMLESITLPELIRKLKLADFSGIAKQQNRLGLSVALGGCGATLEELTGLYASFASQGKYSALSWLASDTIGSVSELISPAAAFVINETLTQLTRLDLPNNYQSSYSVPKVAWKTGTSYGRRDAWSIGYNQHYTIGVWVGNFSGEGVPELTGADVATPLLFEIFNAIDHQSGKDWFRAPKEISFRLVCDASGQVPGEFCENQVADYFVPLVSANLQCTHLKTVYVSAGEDYAYCRSCLPAAGFKKKLYPNFAPELAAFYEYSGKAYLKVPPHNPLCTKLFSGQAPVITSPSDKKEYIIEEGSQTELMLSCNAGNEVTTVYWYINDQFLQKAEANEKLFFKPAIGDVKISCSDDKGRNTNINILVKKL
jgi:penicillin-binding protein 1C